MLTCYRTVAASLSRLVIMVRIATVGFDPNEDPSCEFYIKSRGGGEANLRTVVITGFLYWGVVECGISVLAACLPSLQFLFRGWSWKSILEFKSSQLQTYTSGSGNIHVNQGYDVAYGESRDDVSNSELIVRLPIPGREDSTPRFGTETYIMKDAQADRNV